MASANTPRDKKKAFLPYRHQNSTETAILQTDNFFK